MADPRKGEHHASRARDMLRQGRLAEAERELRAAVASDPSRGDWLLNLGWTLEATGRRVTVLTQNVDGLHRAAGSTDVIEIHGDLHDLRCTRCAWAERVGDYSALELPPRCPRCSALVRPEVVLFGERLPAAAVGRLEAALRRGFDAVFSVGTTSVFPYVAAPVLLARSWGGRAVEVNPGETAVSGVADVRLRCGAAAALGAVAAAIDRAGIR